MSDVDYGNMAIYMDFADIGTERVGNFGGSEAKLDEFLGTHLGISQAQLTKEQLQESHGLEGTDDQVRSALKSAQYQQDSGQMEPKMSDYKVQDTFTITEKVMDVLTENLPVDCVISKLFCDAALGDKYPESKIAGPNSMTTQAETDILDHQSQNDQNLETITQGM